MKRPLHPLRIIVCNIGSSSFKFQLLDMPAERQLARGYTERVGSDDAIITYWVGDRQVLQTRIAVPSHRQAVQHALTFLTDPEIGLLDNLDAIDGIGFKTIQAGDKNGSVLLDDAVLQAMEDYRDLAPAHNPPYLTAIYMFREMLPKTPLVGVFEPGFHLNMPLHARVYGTPYEWIEKYGVKKYGYHGASHRYVTAETVRVLGLPPDNHRVITCHLGGSSSLCAYKNGKSIDTSMGFTPQSGLIQGTRIGDMDPFVLPYIMVKKGITLEQALAECSKSGGLKGLSGISADMREIKEAIARGDARAKLAWDKFIYDIKRYIGEYLVLLEGVDAVTFTGGIGENNADLREEVLSALRFLGLELDKAANAAHAQLITTSKSKIRALVLKTDEEIVVARETVRVMSGS
ncbi:MAG TPA: acetate/propionate family kinase [bacterium]|nr:acetate/propionate family kinase [bacterium]HNT66627.1 acetate/propionate family kinase [bacterium]